MNSCTGHVHPRPSRNMCRHPSPARRAQGGSTQRASGPHTSRPIRPMPFRSHAWGAGLASGRGWDSAAGGARMAARGAAGAKGREGRGWGRDVRGTEGKRRRRRREEKLDAAEAAKDSGGSLRFTGESPTRPGILCVAPLVPDDALGSRTALRPSQTPRVPSSTTVHPTRVPLTPYVLAGVAAAGMAAEWMRRPSACAW